MIITARKRVERLQETPIAISAFSDEALKVAGIANIRDLQESVPGLNLSEMGNKAPSIFIRGVGQKESLAALDPGVVFTSIRFISRAPTASYWTLWTLSRYRYCAAHKGPSLAKTIPVVPCWSPPKNRIPMP